MSLKTMRLNERKKKVTGSHKEENLKKKEQSWVDFDGDEVLGAWRGSCDRNGLQKGKHNQEWIGVVLARR